MLKTGWFIAAALGIAGCVGLSQEIDGKKHLSIATRRDSLPLSVSAANIVREGRYPLSSLHLSGGVEIVAPVCYRTAPGQALSCPSEMVLTGENVVLHEDTGEIESNGTVRVIPLRPVR